MAELKDQRAHNPRYLNSKKFDYKNRKSPASGNPKPGTGNRVWARGDLNSGPFDYQSNAPTRLSYGPFSAQIVSGIIFLIMAYFVRR